LSNIVMISYFVLVICAVNISFIKE